MSTHHKICAIKGCHNRLPDGRRKYCSDECAKIAKAKRNLGYYHTYKRKKWHPRKCWACKKKFTPTEDTHFCPECTEKGFFVERTKKKIRKRENYPIKYDLQPKSLAGCSKLWAAVMDRAIDDYRNTRVSSLDAQQATDWLFSKHGKYLDNSCENLCVMLGVDREAMLESLRE